MYRFSANLVSKTRVAQNSKQVVSRLGWIRNYGAKDIRFGVQPNPSRMISPRFFSSRPRRLYSREEQNKYIELQNTRKLSRLYGKLPIPKMHRRTTRTSYIPFLLSLEKRLDVILVRIRFCETIPQARQLISHRKVFVNNGVVAITHFKLSPGDIISFQQNKDFPETKTKDVAKGSGGEGGILGNNQGGLFAPTAKGLASGGVASRSFSTVTRGRGLAPFKQSISSLPTVHYHMGGVPTNCHGEAGTTTGNDPDAQTPGLMPAGESACTSVHGANFLLDIDAHRRACANRVSEILSSGCQSFDKAWESVMHWITKSSINKSTI